MTASPMRPAPHARARRAAFLIAITVSLAALSGCGGNVAPTRVDMRSGAPSGDRAGGTVALSSSDYEPDQILWWSFAPEDEADVETGYNLVPIDRLGGAILCQVPLGTDPATLANDMNADARVWSAEPNWIAETAESRGHSFAFDDGFDRVTGFYDQSATRRLGLAAAQRVSKGSGVLVAVLDTGIDPGHRQFVGRLEFGHDFVDGDGDPTEWPDGVDSDLDGLVDEALGHGSHVAGIISLTAPAARILPLRVLDNDGRGRVTDIARAIDYAVARHARVINVSLGMLSDARLLKEAVQRALATGAIVVASAGNWGAEIPEEYPANMDYTFAIAASDTSDMPASFTSYGSNIALLAPGEAIRSAYWNGHTAVWSGTSMSAPWVSGGAALLLSLHPDWGRNQVLQRLAATARPLDPSVPEATQHFGAGLLDLGAALAPDRGPEGTPDTPIVQATPGRSR